MLATLILSGMLLGMAIGKPGFGFLVFINLILSASAFAFLLVYIFS